ncbi:hypothetical protein BH20ACI3_BH20ACI3_03500 [soil metagenome]
MGMIRVEVVDLHINPFFNRVIREVDRGLRGGLFIQHPLASKGFPDEVNPNTRVGVS